MSGPFRTQLTRIVRPPILDGEAMVCRVLGHSWWIFFSRAIERLDDQPRGCSRCGTFDTRGATEQQAYEAIAEDMRWLARRA